MNMNLTVYKILNKTTGKFYIGSTSNFEIRKSEHIGMLKNKSHHNKFLQYDWNKYGPSSFDFFPIKQGFANTEQMVLTEYELIHKTFDQNYNIDTNNYITEVHKKRSSKFTKGKHSNYVQCDPKYKKKPKKN